MENRAHALMAGLFTIALLIAAVLIGLWFNRDRVQWVPYEMATKLSVPGLEPQAAVRYRGLDVGRVDDITFDPEVPGQILIHVRIKPDTPITQSTYAVLGYQGVTGIAYIQLDDDGTLPTKVPSSKQKVARIVLRPSLIDTLQNKGLAILEQTEKLMTRVNALVSADNQKVMLGAFENISSAATSIQQIPRQLQPTLDKLPALTADVRSTLVSVQKLSGDASTLTRNLNTLTSNLQAPNGAIAHLTATTDEVSAVANGFALELAPLTSEARSTIRLLNRTLNNFNERPQSILFGGSSTAPGPGEAGFVAPGQQ